MRYLLIDRITGLSPPGRATGVKCVSLSDDCFVDHFPGHPVMPGALILEALAQLGGVLVEASIREKGRGDLLALLAMVDRARFRSPVRPGDRLELEVSGSTVSEDGGRVSGVAKVDGNTVAEAELTFAFAKVASEKALARRKAVVDVWLNGSAEDP